MSPFVRKHSLSAGGADALAATRVHEDVVVTAVLTRPDARLKLIAWQVVGDELVRRGEAAGGGVGSVSICRVGSTRVATCCRDSSGFLKVALWDVTAQGEIEHLDTAAAGTIGSGAPVGLGPRWIVTPVTDSAAELKVIAWEVSDSGQLTRRGDASGGRAGLLSTDSWSDRRFVTALRNASGNLELIHWVVRENGDVDRLGEVAAGPVGGISIVRHHELASLDEQVFMTAVRAESGKLKLIAWRATAEGPIERLSELVPGLRGDRPSLAHVGNGRHAVAFVDSEDELYVQCFRWGSQPGPTGTGFTIVESGSGGKIYLVAAADVGDSSCVTAVRDANGNLKMILWKLEPLG